MLGKCSTRFPHGDLLLEGMTDFSAGVFKIFWNTSSMNWFWDQLRRVM